MKPLARRLYRAAITVLLLAYAAADRVAQRRRPYDPSSVRRLLVMRPGLLGDGALLTPALRLLRRSFPAAEIHVLATGIQAPLLQPLPCVDRVIPWTAGDLLEPRRALRPGAWRAALATLRQLRAARYDAALSCYGRLGSAIALLSGARHRFGFAGEALPGTLTGRLPGARYDRPWHDVEYSAAIARLAGARGETPPLELVVEAGARRAAAALLEETLDGSPEVIHRPGCNAERSEASVEVGMTLATAARTPRCTRGDNIATIAGSPRQQSASSPALVVLHAGATNGRAKRWPVAHWITLARRLADDGARVVLVGGPEDRAIAEAIAHGAGFSPGNAPVRPVGNLVGRTTIPVLLAVLERADVVVTGDSGPMHLAVALRRPTVAIHGPTDPTHSGPSDLAVATVVRHPLPCSPCYRLDRVADCPLGHTLCQRLLHPETVYTATLAALPQSKIQNPQSPIA